MIERIEAPFSCVSLQKEPQIGICRWNRTRWVDVADVEDIAPSEEGRLQAAQEKNVPRSTSTYY